MNILVASHTFHPAIGGTEGVGQILSDGFARAGHPVRVVTDRRQETSERSQESGAGSQKIGGEGGASGYRVIRRPGFSELLAQVRWCDVAFHNNISLRAAWPLALVRRRWVIAHHTPIRRLDGTLGWRDRIKRHLLRYATNIAPSRALADRLPVASAVIGNPYREDVFFSRPGVTRDRDLIFVGRLVSEKGLQTLIEALKILAGHGIRPSLTVVGTGPDEARMKAAGANLDIRFVGALVGETLAHAYCAHRALVIPSVWESFGVAALEGLACGCAVIASRVGGLVEAVGGCGDFFPQGDAGALAALIGRPVAPPEREAVRGQLAPHRPDVVVGRYLEIIGGTCE
jgi:glycosyltransferase involved in cell wall biosynthesis